MKKSLYISIPLGIAISLIERDLLNPNYCSHILAYCLRCKDEVEYKDIELKGDMYKYTFKIDSFLHDDLKYNALRLRMSMAEMCGKMFVSCIS